MKLLIINGPNLNMLGQRDPDTYGHLTLAEICSVVERRAWALQAEVTFYQANGEGELIDFIQQNVATAQGIIINPGVYEANKDQLKVLMTLSDTEDASETYGGAPRPSDFGLDIGVTELCDFVKIKARKGGTKILTLAQDRQPGQPGLETLQADLFEEPDIVIDGQTPFVIVVMEIIGQVAGPEATRHPIRSDNQPVVIRHENILYSYSKCQRLMHASQPSTRLTTR